MSTAGQASATWISLLTASISTVVIAVLGIPLAWMLAQRRGRLWDAIGLAVQLPLALPPLMSGILLLEVVGPYTLLGRVFGGGLTDTTAAIVLAQTFVAAPFLVVTARSAFATVDPGLLEVAATLGHGGWSRFRRVSLPSAAPGIRAGLLLAWLRAFGEFGATVILAYHPYSLPVFTFVQFSSTGLPSALPPTGIAILAAALVLLLTHSRPGHWLWARYRRRRDRADAIASATSPSGATPPDRRPPADHPRPASRAAELAFDLRARIGSFQLALAHAGSSPHLAIVGPSGAGKSLTLRCLAGLRGTTVGAVRLGGHDLGHLDAERRRVGWVPQGAGLIPHLDVWRQVTFAVGADPTVARAWLQRLGLENLINRLPAELSGGQRQRVALVRALAHDPDLLLLDEPFSSLDRPVRDELRRELRRVQREAGVSTVLVTHDPEEAALLADEVVILDAGQALQAGSREAVFARPASPQVARLLAIDNLRSGRVSGPGRLISHGSELQVDDLDLPTGTAVSWCVRAEHVSLLTDDAVPADGSDSRLTGAGPPVEGGQATPTATIQEVLDLGAWREVVIALDGGLVLTARTVDGRGLAAGQSYRVRIAAQSVTVWESGNDGYSDVAPTPSARTG
jgi:molybdate transport system permease protein